MLYRVAGTTNHVLRGGRDAVFEAATESFDLKSSTLASISRSTPDDIFIATSSSLLSMAALATQVRERERYGHLLFQFGGDDGVHRDGGRQPRWP